MEPLNEKFQSLFQELKTYHISDVDFEGMSTQILSQSAQVLSELHDNIGYFLSKCHDRVPAQDSNLLRTKRKLAAVRYQKMTDELKDRRYRVALNAQSELSELRRAVKDLVPSEIAFTVFEHVKERLGRI
jgi:hypothetical protein